MRAALAVLVFPAAASAAIPCEPLPTGFTTAAHRGAAELAPENTLDAYRYAITYGVDMIEVDVQQTLDGRFVSSHDTEVDAKTDGTGRIGLMTFAQPRALKHGIGPPRKPVRAGAGVRITDRDGCVRRDGRRPVRLDGDGSALASALGR